MYHYQPRVKGNIKMLTAINVELREICKCGLIDKYRLYTYLGHQMRKCYSNFDKLFS